MTGTVLAASLAGSGHYVTVGPVQVSLANLVVIGLMVLVFALAVVLPFPRGKR